MRPSVLVFFLLLSLLVSAAQAIRFKNEQLFSFHHHEIHEAAETSSSSLIKTSGGSDPVGDKVTVLCKEGNCITGTMKIKRVSKKSKHLFPSIHEDYYGPRHHRSRHH